MSAKEFENTLRNNLEPFIEEINSLGTKYNIYSVIKESIEEFGLENFKKTSLFASNEMRDKMSEVKKDEQIKVLIELEIDKENFSDFLQDVGNLKDNLTCLSEIKSFKILNIPSEMEIDI